MGIFKAKSKHRHLKKHISIFITKFLIVIIILLFLLVLNKYYPEKTKKLKHYLYDKSLNFIKFNDLSKKIIGKEVFFSPNKTSQAVINDELIANGFTSYYNGEKINVSDLLPIGSISSGVVIYKGNKDNYGKTVIIQGRDGFNIWYGNIENSNIDLYTYIEKGTLIGNAKGNYIYLVIEKDGKYYKYEEYKNIKY